MKYLILILLPFLQACPLVTMPVQSHHHYYDKKSKGQSELDKFDPWRDSRPRGQLYPSARSRLRDTLYE